VRIKSQLGWLNLLHTQRVVIIPRDPPQEEINGYGGKDFEKWKVLR